MITNNNQSQEAISSQVSSRVMSATLAAMLGLFLLFAAGFANSQILHNAAHDSRHAASFPCH